MQPARSSHLDDKTRSSSIRATHLDLNAPRRAEAEDFIRNIFHERYGADVKSFAPNLMLIEEDGRIVASAGWRGANSEPLFLERYLDAPIGMITPPDARIAYGPDGDRACLPQLDQIMAEAERLVKW